MFVIRCTTCGSQLAVKSDALLGQILACPKCGGMVLVQKPEEESPLDRALRQPDPNPTPPFTAFPEPSMMETASGILQPDVVERLLQPEVPPEAALAEAELRTRKILLSVLIGLLLLLALSVGVLIMVKGKDKDRPVAAIPAAAPDVVSAAPPQELDQTIAQESVETKPGEQVSSPPGDPKVEPKKEEKDTQSELLGKLLAQTPVEPEMSELVENPATTARTQEHALTTQPEPKEIRSTTDLLATLERKMPGLLAPGETAAVDIPARLALPLAELKLQDVALLTFVRTLERLSEIPFTLDVDEFRCRGIRVDAPVTGEFHGSTMGEILSSVLATHTLEPVIEDRQILITILEEPRDRLVARSFDVSDFAVTELEELEKLSPEQLVDLLRRLVDPVGFSQPESMQTTPEQTKPDRPSLKIEGNTLVLRHRPSKLDASLRLLEQLRVLRGLAQTTEVVGEDLAPEAFGWDGVMQPLTLNYYQPTPLAGVLAQIEEKTGLTILADHRALHQALCPLDRLKATVRCNQGTVNEALENLLGPVDVTTLTYRIVTSHVLEVTTVQAARRPEKMNIEVHRFQTPEKKLPAGETPEELVKTVRAALEPDTWFDPANADTLGLGDVVIDRASGCLIVRQSQPVQRQIRLWLGKKLSDTASGEAGEE